MGLRSGGSADRSGTARGSVVVAASQLALALVATAIVLPAPAAAAPSSSFSFGVAGDFGFGADGQATISLAGGAGLDFFLFVGDTTYGTTNESNWCNDFRAQVPHVLAEAGNHDTGESAGASLGALLAACPYDLTEPMMGSYGREWYVDYPGSAPLVRLVLTGCGVRFDAGNGSQWLCAT